MFFVFAWSFYDSGLTKKLIANIGTDIHYTQSVCMLLYAIKNFSMKFNKFIFY